MNPGPAANIAASKWLKSSINIGAGATVLLGGPLLLVAAVLLLMKTVHRGDQAVTPHAVLLATLSVILYLSTFTALTFGIRKLRTGGWVRTAEERQRSRERLNTPAWRRWRRAGIILAFALDFLGIGMLVRVKSRNPHLNMTFELSFSILAFLISASVFTLARTGKATSARLSIRP